MKYSKYFPKLLIGLFVPILFFSACSDSESVIEANGSDFTDQEVLLKLIDQDESLASFEPNYNEEGVMDFTGSLGKEIYPVRVGQKMVMTDRTLDAVFEGDTVYGTLTKSFEGILFIAASYDEFTPGEPGVIDTLIEKQFYSVVTQNLIFVKVANFDNPLRNWKIYSVSLPEGGTGSSGINILSMSILLPGGDQIDIDSPNDYYMTRFPGMNGQVPVLHRGEEVSVTVVVESAYPDTDFVSLTYGGFHGGPHHRAKRLFDLVDETFNGQTYTRTYSQSWIVGQFMGPKHAIVNALPKQVLFDDSTPVEENSWGMPYVVR